MHTASDDLFERLIALPTARERSRVLRDAARALDSAGVERLADRLKDHANACFLKDIDVCDEFAELILELGRIAEAPLVHAIGTRISAIVHMMRTNDAAGALRRFDEAAAIHLELDDPVGWALVQSVRIIPLGELGRMDEALADAGRAASILEAHGLWRSRGRLLANVAFRLQRAQRYPEALVAIDEALEMMRASGDDEARDIPNLQLTKGMVLVNLGRSREAIDVLLEALERSQQLGQTALSAQLVANLGRARFAVGLFARALSAYEHACDIFEANGAEGDEALTRLLISECLIHLRRFDSAILQSRRAREVFERSGRVSQAGQALINEGMAQHGIGRIQEALEIFERACGLFENSNDPMWLAEARLHAARAMRSTGAPEKALAIVQESARVLDSAGAALEGAQAQLYAAAISHEIGETERAVELIDEVVNFAADEKIDHLLLDALRLRADIAHDAGDVETALTLYLRAVEAFERAQGQIVTEHRSDFVGGRDTVYERIVDIYLSAGDEGSALAFVERAKARASIAQIERGGGVRTEAPSPEDRRITDEIDRLVVDRARLIERSRRSGPQSESGSARSDEGETVGADDGTAARSIRQIERRIAALRDSLIVRHLDFVEGGEVWSMELRDIARHVPPGTVVLEYFRIGECFVGFAITPDESTSVRLELDQRRVRELLRALNFNFMTAPHADGRHLEDLTDRANAILGHFHAALIAPFADQIASATTLLVVPHGNLHHVPFHALHDGRTYLATTHDVSYLPAASHLISIGSRVEAQVAVQVNVAAEVEVEPDVGVEAAVALAHATAPGAGATELTTLAIGHECGGRLPNAVTEASEVAAMWGGTSLLDSAATRTSVRQLLPCARLIHIAAHGEYVAQSPLFSGIQLEDGALTALDIFETRLQASLVTLSACDSGLSTIGGGDEIQGVIRAFLSAGARSIVASLWTIEDQSGGDFMRRFYAALRDGQAKSTALNATYREFMDGRVIDGSGAEREKRAVRYVHPYYWAPYMLIGDPGAFR